MKTTAATMNLEREKSNFHVYSTLVLFWAISLLTAVCLFLVPSNMYLKFLESSGYVGGLFIDYLVPKLYVNDIISLLLLLCCLGWWWIHPQPSLTRASLRQVRWAAFVKNNLFGLTIVSLVLIMVVRQFISPQPLASLWYFMSLSKIVLLGWALAYFLTSLSQPSLPYHWQKSAWRLIALGISAAILFQSTVALYQYATQHEIAGFIFLGEPQLTKPLGIAKVMLADGTTQVLPYGTTAHPNVLAGVLALYLVLWFWVQHSHQIFSKRVFIGVTILLVLVGTITIIFTQSYTAAATLLLGISVIILYTLKQRLNLNQLSRRTQSLIFLLLLFLSFIVLPLLIHKVAFQYPNNPSLSRRAALQSAALGMVIEKPLLGVGLNNFTAVVEDYVSTTELVSFIQPVHHVGWLWLSEAGLVGIILIMLVMWHYVSNSINQQDRWNRLLLLMIIILPIFSLDHYLLSLQTGLMLSMFVILFWLLSTSSNSSESSCHDKVGFRNYYLDKHPRRTANCRTMFRSSET